jgi:hypothetical protein
MNIRKLNDDPGIVYPEEIARVVEDAEGNWVGVGDKVSHRGWNNASEVVVTGFMRDANLRAGHAFQDSPARDTGLVVAIDGETGYIDTPYWSKPLDLVLVDEPDADALTDAEKARNGIQVYVAGPYSEGELDKNMRIVIFAAEILVERGKIQGHHVAPWIPHLNKLWHDEVPHEYDFWLDLDFVHLSNCDACFRVGGRSPGADREEAVCEELGIPYFTCFTDYEEWLSTQ